MNFIPSRYNYFVPYGENVIIFNGISERFFIVNGERACYYKLILDDPMQYAADFERFMYKMLEEGFVHEHSVDEKVLIDDKYNALSGNHQYYLMILPTYQCNVRCWYCVQDHRGLWMSEDTFSKIKTRITKKLDDPEITSFHLSWFGGEPLLAYSEIVKFTKYARIEAEKRGKAFSCAITSNGILLNSERIEALREAGVNSYQITIDGTRDMHDKIKQIANRSAFDVSMRNINELARHTQCVLRFNYTHENLKPNEIISNINERISFESRKNITFMMFKVWQEGESKIDPNAVDSLFQQGRDIGLRSLLPRCGMCYADFNHFDCIFPDGSCEKCDNESPLAAKGRLTEDGNIEWSTNVTALHTPVYKTSETECETCKYLPMCWGPCEAKRESMLREVGRIHCYRKDKDEYMFGMIRNIVKNETK